MNRSVGASSAPSLPVENKFVSTEFRNGSQKKNCSSTYNSHIRVQPCLATAQTSQVSIQDRPRFCPKGRGHRNSKIGPDPKPLHLGEDQQKESKALPEVSSPKPNQEQGNNAFSHMMNNQRNFNKLRSNAFISTRIIPLLGQMVAVVMMTV